MTICLLVYFKHLLEREFGLDLSFTLKAKIQTEVALWYWSCISFLTDVILWWLVTECHIKHRDRHLDKFICCYTGTECLFVGCLTSQQHASVSQGRICTDNFTCCHTEIEAADQTFHLTQSQYTDTGPTSPSTDPITPGAWQGSHWSANV